MDPFWSDVMETLKPAAQFALHSIVGIVLFVIVGFGAFFVDRLTHWLGAMGAQPAIVLVLSGLAYFLFAIDVLCFVVFMIKECLVFVFEMIDRPSSFGSRGGDQH